MLEIVASHHFMQFQGKLMNQSSENDKKKIVLGLTLAHLTQIRTPKFFFKNLASSVTRYHGQLSSCTISEKTNDPILRKLSDGQTDESDFIGRCPTNVERPIREINLLINMQINISSCRTSGHYFSLSIQRLLWDLLGSKNASSTHP